MHALFDLGINETNYNLSLRACNHALFFLSMKHMASEALVSGNPCIFFTYMVLFE